MWLAPGMLTPLHWAFTLLGIAGTVGAANALNCYIERDIDRAMVRTRSRPLPAGRMEPGVALRFAIALAAVSLPVLALASNLLTGWLATRWSLRWLLTASMAVLASSLAAFPLVTTETHLYVYTAVFAVATGEVALEDRVHGLAELGTTAANVLARAVARGVYEAAPTPSFWTGPPAYRTLFAPRR